MKFELGLFDNPYVDVDAVAAKVGKVEARLLGHESQMRAMTLLKNGSADVAALPLPTGTLKVYVDGIDSSAVSEYAAIANSPEEADVAILRIDTPWYPVESDNPFAQGFHHGDLDFKGERKQEILDLLHTVGTNDRRDLPGSAGGHSRYRGQRQRSHRRLRCQRSGRRRSAIRHRETRGQIAVRAAVVNGSGA